MEVDWIALLGSSVVGAAGDEVHQKIGERRPSASGRRLHARRRRTIWWRMAVQCADLAGTWVCWLAEHGAAIRAGSRRIRLVVGVGLCAMGDEWRLLKAEGE
jgi:hypothetical protein